MKMLRHLAFAAALASACAIADDAAGLLRVGVDPEGETAGEMPFSPFGDATPTNFLSGPFFGGDGDAAPDWLYVFPRSAETNHAAVYSPDGWLDPATGEQTGMAAAAGDTLVFVPGDGGGAAPFDAFLFGRIVAETDGRGNTRRTEFNSVGQKFATVDAMGNRTEYAYDQFGNLASATDPLGNATVYGYDIRGRKIYEGGATYPVRYTYDVFGNTTTMMTYRDESLGPDSGDVTTWLREDGSGALVAKIYADGKGPTYDYTPEGRLSRRTWARGVTTDYSYDGWGNLTNTVYSDDTPTVSIRYDAMGRQIEALDAAGTTTFAYDSFGSLTNETVSGFAKTNVLERHWDRFGRNVGYTLHDDPARESVAYSYDDTGRFASVEFGQTTNRSIVNYNYLSGSDLISGYTCGKFKRSVFFIAQATVYSPLRTALEEM